MEKLLKAAYLYTQQGYSVIPVIGKRPAVESWLEYQKRLPTKDELFTWFTSESVTGIGIITGKISGIVVLDIEANGDVSSKHIPITATARSGGGGVHYYFKRPDQDVVKSINLRSSLGIEGDFKADGGYVVAPMSLHESGKHYEWVINLEDGIADTPDWLQQLSTSHKIEKKDWLGVFEGVKEGNRHNTLMSLAGKLVSCIPEKHWSDIAWPTLSLWNEKNTPPLESKEVKDAFTYCVDKKVSEITKNDKERGLLSLKDVLNTPEEANAFLINGLLPRLGITALTGHPSGGKSWIMLAMAKAVAIGEKLFDKYETIQGAVLIIDEENGIFEFKRRLKFLNMTEDLNIYFYCQNGLKVDDPDDQKNILSVIREKDIKLVVIDPFVAIHSKNENTSNEMQSIMDIFAEFNRAGATVMYVHHHRKDGLNKSNASQAIRGSSAFSGRADSHIAVEKKEESEAGIEIAVSQEKLRRGKKVEPFTIMLVEDNGRISLDYSNGIKEDLHKKEIAKSIIQTTIAVGNDKDTDEIIAILSQEGIGSKNTREALRELVKEGHILKYKDGKKDKFSMKRYGSDDLLDLA